MSTASQSDTTTRPTTGASDPAEPTTGPATGPSIAGPTIAGHRIDPPHQTVADRESPAPVPEQSDEDLLLQASRIAEGLRSRTSELSRREKSLAEQLAAIDAERRSFRLTVEESRNEIEERISTLDEREAGLDDRLASCERLADELDAANERLTADRATLDAERETLRGELETEYAEKRAAVDQESRSLAEQRERLHAEAEEIRAARSRELAERQSWFETERINLREQVGADLEAARAAFEQERTAWENERITQTADIERERELNETAIRRAQQVIEELRESQRAEIEQARQELDDEIDRRHTECATECEAERQRTQSELRQQEGRIRFQREHLERTRNECEREQSGHAHGRQRFVQFREQETNLLHLRRVQLDHYRVLLEERERSVEREKALIDRAKQAGLTETRRGRERLVTDREAFEQEKQARLAEVQRQHDILGVHAQKLEDRRKRLDELRADLEETHRSTLEMRLSIEEELAQLSNIVGPDEAKQRIDAAREALGEHYRHVREALNDQQQEIEEARTTLDLQRDEFRDERHTMTEWISERDDALRDREERLRREEDEFTSNECVWQQARERWLHEKIAAEEVIRDLLRQLTEFAAEGTGSLAARDDAA